ncbi:DUF3102 domain-containing protein [Desulfosporosinus sp.]|uniref:DUF3102 domain-containing protein n=1 Tax=Desulfosporosinus sp. TaxID=157907 RepID=UPI0025B9FB04|nr:DUF3102 domain-containing protein [Desulfosporosinus sp.]MBC2721821.1 DUF3102 domain-containing protein [Desulfosporosinus sp.]MBC2726275.1 DUF3102 domain-containing protein [Desulfosporosinus sp.]
MNEIAMVDKNLSVDRTPDMIAIEINSIKEQTRKIVLFNSIEIGRRLAEAKLMLPHGEWGDWLSKSVDYSQRTASNLIRIFEEYGSSQMVLFCDNAKSHALANLSYTQAVALLGIPQDERAAFIHDHDIDNMSTRELQQAIKEKQELEAKVMELEVAWAKDKTVAVNSKRIADEKAEEAQKLLEEKQNIESDLRVTDKVLRDTQADVKRLQDALEEERQQSKAEAERLAGLLSEAKANGASDEKVTQLQKELEEARKLVDTLTQELDKPIEVTAAPVVERVPEEIERELAELRERNKELEAKGSQPISTATIRFKLHFDSLVKGFGELLRVLEEIEDGDRDKYRSAVKALIGKMSEKL